MPFNAFDFIFVFLPITTVTFFVLQKYLGHTQSLLFLLVACFTFYGWWDPGLIWIIFASIFLNYICNYILTGLDQKRNRIRMGVMLVGVAANLALIGYYKYFFFAAIVSNDLFDTHYSTVQLILPLGISFFTFQQIAFLVDTWGNHVKRQNLLHYSLFVTFFPQLIAGPIVRHDELLPQFETKRRFSQMNLSVGLSFFIIGLFKKVIIADNLALFATPIFSKAATGSPMTLLDAWGGATAYGFQLYFDISGYADMAVGLGRMFGIRIPLNFNSPFKATSIIDFWQRWHLTLTQFLTGYCYNPITLKITRYRMQKGLPGLRGGMGKPGAFLSLLAFPSIVTMTLAGIWHGAGYQFLAFGFLHGCFLVANHAWRGLTHKLQTSLSTASKASLRYLSMALTLIVVIALFVPFRADSLETTFNIWKGMVGLNGVVMRENYLAAFGPLGPFLQGLGVQFSETTSLVFKGKDQIGWTLAALFVCWILPNSQEVMGRYLRVCDQGLPPADGTPDFPSYARNRSIPSIFQWRPNALWAALTMAAAVMIINTLTSTSEFLYFRF